MSRNQFPVLIPATAKERISGDCLRLAPVGNALVDAALTDKANIETPDLAQTSRFTHLRSALNEFKVRSDVLCNGLGRR